MPAAYPTAWPTKPRFRDNAVWLSTLARPDLSVTDREEIYWAMHDYFRAASGSWLRALVA